MMRMGIIALWLALGLSGCSDRQRLNPLDPQSSADGDGLGNLEVMAGNSRVDLSWDYSQVTDVEGYQR